MFLAPHPPLQIPEPWYGKISENQFELPENVGVFYKKQSLLQMYNLTGIVGARYDRNHWKEAWRVYLGLVSMLDDCVGQIIDELKEQGIYDDSLIIFTSDHGEMLGSHGLFQNEAFYELYDLEKDPQETTNLMFDEAYDQTYGPFDAP